MKTKLSVPFALLHFLQIILLVSGFCLLVAVYYVIDVLFDNEAEPDVSDPPSTPDGNDSSSLIPDRLAEQDRIRLRYHYTASLYLKAPIKLIF